MKLKQSYCHFESLMYFMLYPDFIQMPQYERPVALVTFGRGFASMNEDCKSITVITIFNHHSAVYGGTGLNLGACRFPVLEAQE